MDLDDLLLVTLVLAWPSSWGDARPQVTLILRWPLSSGDFVLRWPSSWGDFVLRWPSSWGDLRPEVTSSWGYLGCPSSWGDPFPEVTLVLGWPSPWGSSHVQKTRYNVQQNRYCRHHCFVSLCIGWKVNPVEILLEQILLVISLFFPFLWHVYYKIWFLY